jgi:hypothetical protein
MYGPGTRRTRRRKMMKRRSSRRKKRKKRKKRKMRARRRMVRRKRIVRTAQRRRTRKVIVIDKKLQSEERKAKARVAVAEPSLPVPSLVARRGGWSTSISLTWTTRGYIVWPFTIRPPSKSNWLLLLTKAMVVVV